MFLVSALITGGILFPLYIGSLNPLSIMGIVVAVSAIATGLEAFSKYGLDNLTVPIGSATLCYSLVQWSL